MSLAQGNNTPTRPRIEPGSPDPESDALTTRPVRPPPFMNFRNMFLNFAKPRERPRMYTNSNECKATSMRPLRFVTELPRYYVNDTFRNIFAQVYEYY